MRVLLSSDQAAWISAPVPARTAQNATTIFLIAAAILGNEYQYDESPFYHRDLRIADRRTA
jgi:hypothetical protein